MEWPFEILDNFSDPLKAMDATLGLFDKHLKNVNEHLAKLDLNLAHLTTDNKKAKKPVDDMAKSLKDLKFLEYGKAAWEMGSKVFELGKSFAETAIEAGEFHRHSERLLEFMLGGKKAGQEELETIERMAKGTTDSVSQVVDTYQMLFSFTQKYGKKATEDVYAAASDVGTILGDNAKATLLEVVRNAEAMGKFDERMVKTLKQVGVATPEKFKAILAAHRHTSVAVIDSMLKSGKISDAEGINELLGLIQKNLDKGGPLGAISKGAAEGSVKTQIKNIGDAWERLFAKVDQKPIAEAFAKIAAALDPATESGKRVEAIIGKAFDVIASGAKFVSDNFEILTAIVGGAFDALDFFGKVIKAVGEGAGDMVFDIVQAFKKAWDAIGTFFQDAYNIGANFIDGLISGIKAGWDKVMNTVTGLGKSAVNAIKDTLGIHSKSKVMEQIGEYTGEGYESGVDRSMRDIMLPTPKFALPDAVMRGGGGSFAMGDTSVEVHVASTGASAHEIGKETADQVRQVVRAEIVRFMESDSIEN